MITVSPAPLTLDKVLVNQYTVDALLDSGADRDVIRQDVCKKIGGTTRTQNTMITGFNAVPVMSRAVLEADICMHPDSPLTGPIGVKSNVLVVDRLPYEMILSRNTMKAMGIKLTNTVNSVNTSNQEEKRIGSLEDVRRYFPQVLTFNPIPHFVVDFEVTDESKLKASRPYRLTNEKAAKLRCALNELMEKGVITYSKSKTPSPVLAVDKPDGTVRPCIDFRSLNQLVPLDPMPFPILDDIISSTGGAKCFTKIDLKNGFNLIGLTPETRHLTAFITPWDVYEYTRLCFGYRNAPQIFQRVITRVLGDLLHGRNVHAFIDDILISSASREETERLTYLVIERLASVKFEINEKKSEFSKSAVTILGRVVDGKTITTREESIRKVRNMKRPENRREVMIWRGLVSYFKSFIPGFSRLMHPINQLTKQDQEFKWTEECEKSFHKMNELITSDPILTLPDYDLPFELAADASHRSTGAILYQRDVKQEKGKQLRVIGFHSHSFNPTELNWSVTDKELAAVLKAILYFRSYLESRHFTVYTDHSALQTLLDMNDAKNKAARWQMKLMSFNFTVKYRKGSQSQDADAISRLCFDGDLSVLNFSLTSGELTAEDKVFLLKTFHDDPANGGHDGELRTYMKLRARFADRWSGMRKDVQTYVKSCPVCQVQKFKFRPKLDYLTVPSHAKTPFHTIRLDFGTLRKKSETIATTRSFIVLVCEYSRYIVAKCIRENTRSLIQFLEAQPFLDKIRVISCDNGGSFSANQFVTWCQHKGIQLKHSAPYAPSSQGLVERKVQTIKSFVSFYPHFPGGYKAAVEAAAKHNNRSFQTGTGCTPQFLAYGIPATFPADKELGLHPELKETPLTDEQIEERRRAVQERMNKNKKRPVFGSGQQVLYKKGADGKEIFGPTIIQKVMTREGHPKTLILEDGNIVAVKHALPYHDRRDFKFAKLTLLTVTLVSLMTTVDGLNHLSPMFWEESVVPVVSGYTHYSHLVAFNDSCGNLLSNNWLQMNQTRFDAIQTRIRRWCYLKVQHHVFDALSPVCDDKTVGLNSIIESDYDVEFVTQSPRRRGKPKRGRRGRGKKKGVQNTTTHHREPRQVGFVLGLGAGAVALWTVIQNDLTSASDSYELALQRESMEAIANKIRDTENHWKQADELFRKEMEELKDVGVHLLHMEHIFLSELETLENVFPIWISLQDKLSTIERQVSDITNDWYFNRIHPSFYQFTNVSTSRHLTPFSSRKHAQPLSCAIDRKAGHIKFDYSIPIRKIDSKLFQAKPFEMQMHVDPTTYGSSFCWLHYVGPEFVIMTGDCVIRMEKGTTYGPLDVQLDTSESQDCHEVSVHTAAKDWRLEKCGIERPNLQIQVRYTDTQILVYCYGLKYTKNETANGYTRSVTRPCPFHILQIPNTDTFEVGGLMFGSKNVHTILNPASELEHYILNQQLRYELDEEMLGIIQNMTTTETELHHLPTPSPPFYLPPHHIFGNALSVTLLVFVVCFIIMFFFCSLNKNRSRTGNSNVPQVEANILLTPNPEQTGLLRELSTPLHHRAVHDDEVSEAHAESEV